MGKKEEEKTKWKGDRKKRDKRDRAKKKCHRKAKSERKKMGIIRERGGESEGERGRERERERERGGGGEGERESQTDFGKDTKRLKRNTLSLCSQKSRCLSVYPHFS